MCPLMCLFLEVVQPESVVMLLSEASASTRVEGILQNPMVQRSNSIRENLTSDTERRF